MLKSSISNLVVVSLPDGHSGEAIDVSEVWIFPQNLLELWAVGCLHCAATVVLLKVRLG